MVFILLLYGAFFACLYNLMTFYTGGLSLLVGFIQMGSYMMTFLKNPGLATFIHTNFSRKLTAAEQKYIFFFYWIENIGAKNVRSSGGLGCSTARIVGCALRSMTTTARGPVSALGGAICIRSMCLCSARLCCSSL